MTGIGDTTEPLPAPVAKAMSDYCLALGTVEGYSGYDPPIEADVKELVAKVCSQRPFGWALRCASLTYLLSFTIPSFHSISLFFPDCCFPCVSAPKF